MGPLVPDIVTNELNLVVALLVGIAFGYILEQAGFSSSRKLTGLFYGTDFTVLRVFFTAGLTAMIGVLLLARFGLLDASLIYVNPTFVPSAILGGLVMGVGFVVGGYCPGTSFCAAAVGRVDGMVFVVGGLAGAFAFGEAFPAVRHLYEAGSLGDITVPAYLGVSPGLFAVAMTVVAVAAFVAVGRIERRVNPSAPVHAFPAARHRLAAAAFLAIAVAAAMVPDARTRLLATAADPTYRRAHPVDRMTPDELAFRILDHDPALVVVDVRTPADFSKGSLPGAVNVAVGDFFGRGMPPAIVQSHRRKVFVADDASEAETVAALAHMLGFGKVAVLEGGWSAFRTTILDRTSPPAEQAESSDLAAFRAGAGQQITALIKAGGGSGTVVKKPKKIAGGCGV